MCYVLGGHGSASGRVDHGKNCHTYETMSAKLTLLLTISQVLMISACAQKHADVQTVAKGDPKQTVTSKPAAQVVFEPPGAEPVTVRVEVARTEAERNLGLMFRKELDENAGMVFVYDRPQRLIFWMRNTFISLDMIFLDAERRVVGVVENTTPQTDTPRSVQGNTQYCVEVNAGFASKHGIGPGVLARFVGID